MENKDLTFQYFIGGLLRVVSNEVSQTFTKKVADRGIGIGEWMVLRTLFEAKLKTPSEVATFAGFTRGATSKMIEKLCRKNLVIREELASDRRYQEIKLTEEAKALVPELIKIAEENDELYFSCLGNEDREIFRQMLNKIAENSSIAGNPLK